MKEYRNFVKQLESGLKLFASNTNVNWKELANKYVDGYAADELRRLVDLETRRQYGAFFTEDSLAKKVFSELNPKLTVDSIIYDCSCGAANLLIAVANILYELKLHKNLEGRLLGTDIHQEFVDAARLRLQINKLIKETNVDSSECGKGTFENIIKADGLQNNAFYQKATHIIVNPPFNKVETKNELDWAKGKVSAAGIFMDKIIQNANEGASIIAILPDVLRSGSRYLKWRAMVEKACVVEKIILLGQFDKHADVDVFAIKLTKTKNNNSPRKINTLDSSQSNKKRALENLFDISVGAVVDNRDSHEGKLREYVISKGLKGWGVEKEMISKRKYSGKPINSPFIVVKRTSRKGDSQRAIATIINSPKPVYVDNHLIILKPKSGKISDCRLVLENLKDKRTDDWINKRIRCRHLTVKVVSKIPVWKEL